MRIPLIALLFILVTGCQERNYYDATGTGPSPIPPPGTTPNPVPNTSTKIEFRVSGTPNSVRVRFTNAVDGTTIVTTTLPYVATITTNESSMFLSLEANAINSTFFDPYPFMSVQIFVNGVLFREAVTSDIFSTLSVGGTWRK